MGGGSGSDFVARSVAGVSGAIERAIFDQELAALPGTLQGVDARAKVVAVLLLLLAVGLTRHIAILVAVCISTIVFAWLSRLRVGEFVRRAWLGMPLFAAVVVIPSLFMLPGKPVIGPLLLSPLYLAISDNALSSAALFVVRVGASVSMVMLLVSTTRWTELLRALKVLRLPESMVVVLGMTYRYLFLLLHSAGNLFLARSSRTVGSTSGAEQRRWAAGAASALLGRSIKMSGDVMMAMQARGFGGELRTAPDSRMRDQDWLLLTAGITAAAVMLLVDRGLG